MDTKDFRATVRQMLKDWNAATDAQRTVATELSILLAKAKEEAKPVRKAGVNYDIPYTPETWNESQRECHQADDLDKAIHKATCLAGGWYHRAVVVWCAVVGQDEQYWILPEDAPQPTDADYHRTYRIERCPDE